MEPNNKHPQQSNEERAKNERINLNDYNGEIDYKKALKAHSSDTPEDLRRVLDEIFGGGSGPVRPDPNNY